MPEFEKKGDPSVLRITTKRTIPESSTLTGTIVSVGTRVTGTGTKFIEEFLYPFGDPTINKPVRDVLRKKFLYDSTQNVVRKIKYVIDDENLELEEAFPVVLAGINVKSPDEDLVDYKGVSLLPIGATAVIDGVTVEDGGVINYGREAGLEPIAVDGSGSPIQVTLLK